MRYSTVEEQCEIYRLLSLGYDEAEVRQMMRSFKLPASEAKKMQARYEELKRNSPVAYVQPAPRVAYRSTVNGMEVRTLRGEVHANGNNTIAGIIAPFHSRSEDLGGFTEILLPGCFSRALSASRDVVALVNHDASMPVGRVSAGTLRLNETSRGLAFDCDLPNTTYAQNLKESIKRGDLKGCSFAFMGATDSWTGSTRSISDIGELIEVSVGVTFPAYSGSSVGVN
jgi:HK97 family phage prohead protease